MQTATFVMQGGPMDGTVVTPPLSDRARALFHFRQPVDARYEVTLVRDTEGRYICRPVPEGDR